jgi:O-acetyl-ADP-ribose deacetylase (regulator of RNase III)
MEHDNAADRQSSSHGPDEDSRALIELSTNLLERSGCEMIAYGINHTGQMVGATAQAILASAGTEARDAARECLAKTDRALGTVVITPSFGLLTSGVQWIAHVVSTPKHTPKAPGWLLPAMRRILEEACKLGVPRIGVVALGTAGGITPETAARMLIDTVRAGRSESKRSTFPRVIFCLPTPRVYQAFLHCLRH